MVQYLHFRILEFPLIYIYTYTYSELCSLRNIKKSDRKNSNRKCLALKKFHPKKIPNTPFFPCFFPSQGEKKKTMFSQPCGYGSRLDTVPIHGSSQSLVISLREKKTSHPIVLGIFHWQMQPH